MKVDLENKVALVTGASRGIGKAIAVSLAENGASVIINYNSSIKDAEDTFEKVKKFNKNSMIFKADISKYEEVKKMIEKTMEKYERIDLLINNAGMNISGDFISYKIENFKDVINVNLYGYIICCRLVSAEMAKNKYGRIINISSIHDEKPSNLKVPYDISKAGIKMLTKTLALELAKYNILVNSVAPGAIYTDINKDVLNDVKYKNKVLSQIPLKRIGKVTDVTGAVLFLCSEDSSYITGTTIYVDGGFLLN